MATGKAKAPEGPEEPDFDTRLARLEALVCELEEGGLGLEAAIERYREGVQLLAGARDQLAGYRKQVEELTQGALDALKPYPGDPDAAGGDPA
jgi:exodeoxyribonuclease VII small subunit